MVGRRAFSALSKDIDKLLAKIEKHWNSRDSIAKKSCLNPSVMLS
jgi:hypothetical protein